MTKGRPATASGRPATASGGRRVVDRHELVDVAEHSRRVADQREALLAQLEQSLTLQREQSERSQRAVQAPRGLA